MADADRQGRGDALGRGHRRHDERTATQLGQGAELLNDRQEFPGFGPSGADIFLREAQRVWPEAAPCVDTKALADAERLGLPKDPERVTYLAGNTEPAVLGAALVRASLDKEVAEDSLRRAA